MKVSPMILNQVVLGVDQYYKFLPWCYASSIINRYEHQFDGELNVKFGPY